MKRRAALWARVVGQVWRESVASGLRQVQLCCLLIKGRRLSWLTSFYSSVSLFTSRSYSNVGVVS